MAGGALHYDLWVEQAYRGIIRQALISVAAHGLPGAQHFFIVFRTVASGVEISEALRKQWPEDMTIVLRHQFWDLAVGREDFAVSLSFNGVPERLTVPYAAILSFADPVAKFGVSFRQETGAFLDQEAAPVLPYPGPYPNPGAGGKPPEPGDAPAAARDDGAGESKIVTLDQFRRK